MIPLYSGGPSLTSVTTSFTILEMADSWPTLVHVETPIGAVVAENPEVDSMSDTFHTLWDKHALPESDTHDLIRTFVKGTPG